MQNMDNEIVKSLLKRQSTGIECLVTTYSGLIFAVVRRTIGTLGTNEDVEECANDVLLAVWNNIESFTGEGSLKSWIAAIAKFKAIDVKRKLNRREAAQSIELIEVISEESADRYTIEKETYEELVELLSNLSERDRLLFIRKYLNEERNKEIANDMGISELTINNRLSRGKKKLKALLLRKGD